MTGFPHDSESFGASVRASMSLGLPNAPATRRTGLAGNVSRDCAASGAAASDIHAASEATIVNCEAPMRPLAQAFVMCGSIVPIPFLQVHKEKPLTTTDSNERARVQYEVAPE